MRRMNFLVNARAVSLERDQTILHYDKVDRASFRLNK
jgi:hypothetical protein